MKKSCLLLCLILVMFLVACGNSSGTTNSSSSSQEAPESNNESDAPASSEEEVYVLKVSHGFPTASSMHTFMEWFDEELRKRSDGRLSLDIYPTAQLMPVDQEIPAILQGQIDMVHSTSPILAGFDPIWNFYELPFTFDYDPRDPSVYLEHKSKFNRSENGGRKIAKMMEEKGLKVLGIGYIDIFGSIFTADVKNLVTDVESAKGLRIRSAGGTVSPETIKSFGANSITIAGTEAITALQQGVIDGTLTVPMYAYSVKLPVKTYTVAPIFNPVTPIIMSLEKFESLPKDLQDILVETGQDYEEYVKQTISKDILEVLPKFESEMGVEIYYPTDEEITEWKEATKPAWEFFESEVEGGKELLEELSNLK